MIELKSIKKEYDRIVLNDLDLKFEYGKIYVIKGVSGCGKTTLLNILGLIDEDFSGDYIWDNVNQKKSFQSNERNKIGYIFQNSLLVSGITIEDNLLFIKNNISLIRHYSNKFGIEHLLKKYPNELSGGERMRVSIVRTLISNPKLILADEPSGALDNDNSKKIANVFSEISTNNNIIIITTHEDCFDSIANEIIYLEYGNIVNTEIKSIKKSTNHVEQYVKNELSRKVSKYVFRNNKPTNIVRILMLSLMFFLILTCIGLEHNIQSILIDSVYADYPMNSFTINLYEYEEYKDKFEFKLYENYKFKQDGFMCYILADKKDSGFSYPGVLSCGTFPQKENEVIVNQKYINSFFGASNYKNYIGKEITINNNEFKISGILDDLTGTELYNLVYYFDYYKSSENEESVYIPYDSIKRFGEIEPSYMLMVVCDNLYKTSAYKELRECFGGSISPWDSEMINVQTTIDSILLVFSLAIIIIIFLSMIFVTNEIKLDLHFRKREFGYLQIFGIAKKEIIKIVFYEKLLQIFISYILAILLYFILAITIKSALDFSIYYNPIWIIVVALFILLYVFIVSYFPSKKFLKRNIIELIKR